MKVYQQNVYLLALRAPSTAPWNSFKCTKVIASRAKLETLLYKSLAGSYILSSKHLSPIYNKSSQSETINTTTLSTHKNFFFFGRINNLEYIATLLQRMTQVRLNMTVILNGPSFTELNIIETNKNFNILRNQILLSYET